MDARASLMRSPALAALCLASCSLGSAPAGRQDGGALASDAGDAGSTIAILSLQPQAPVLTVQTGSPIPTVTFTVTSNGSPVQASFSADHAAIGTLGAGGLFTPTGSAAGIVDVKAFAQGQTLATTVTVQLASVQNGSVAPDAGPGAGGWNGVGGEGPGPAVDDPVKAVLDGTATAEPTLSFLYPYDGTVWPMGQLAPLLQWTAKAELLAAAQGVLIQLTAADFEYKGYFGRPAPLAAGAAFQRHPIPQDAWDAATRSAGGGTLQVQLTLAAGGVAYGPIAQSWKVSSSPLKGVVYYQSYGTNLAKNAGGAINTPSGLYGGATLAIKPGATDPTLVAGKDGDPSTLVGCRVCHSVSGDGSRMVVQHGENYDLSSSYDLKNGYAESTYQTGGDFKFAGLFPDGSLGLTSHADPPFNSTGTASALYDLGTGNTVASPGLSDFVTGAGFPAFSPDGKSVAFNFWSGPGGAIATGDGSTLVSMAFDRASTTFSAPKALYKSTSAKPPAWPSFLPTNDSLVFEVVLPGNTSGELFATRYGGKGELWWVDVATGTAHSLDRANGKDSGTSYLPTSASHPDDTVLNYEPTVCPLPSGGYAWLIFMSRRQYGNVATIDPWWSDPRDHDLTVTPTPKKLWVAALDLDAPAGSDPSHPAFYLPAQEILAGNSRGFWVIEPCQQDGATCQGGDQCCGGYCVKTGGELVNGVCGSTSSQCSQEYDKCTSSGDCCQASLTCVNQRCLNLGPQ